MPCNTSTLNLGRFAPKRAASQCLSHTSFRENSGGYRHPLWSWHLMEPLREQDQMETHVESQFSDPVTATQRAPRGPAVSRPAAGIRA